jgi:L-ascorbate metabolism protein UlaG (beta-lactamase superfamily)
VASSSGKSRRIPTSDHYDGRRFFNSPRESKRTFWHFLKWQLSGNRQAWPKSVENTATPQLATELASDEIAVTFVNHATLLLQVKGHNILTDPVWSLRTSPVQWMGPKRVRPPGLAFEKLPPIDLVLVSHNHYDHMDKTSLQRLEHAFHPRFVVAMGDEPAMRGFGATHVHEMDWWEELEISHDLKVVFTPCRHWSGRSLRDRYRSLWGAFLIVYKGRKIYFGGDAGYSKVYAEMFRRYGPMDLAFLPIGAYEPRWFMREAHMNPEEAVQAHLDLRAQKSIGIHFGTFQLTDEAHDEPVRALREAKSRARVFDESFSVLAEGETRRISFAHRSTLGTNP